MAGYPGMGQERRISAEALRGLIRDLFLAARLSAEDADLMADIIVHTDARGIYSHGSALIPDYIERILAGEINPRGRPTVAREVGSCLLVDGDGAMGHIACVYGMRAAIARARETGIALAAVGHSNHCGAMSYYPTLAMKEDMIGIATTNAVPTMAPWGGLDRLVGISPIGVGIPSDTEIPILLDVSFSAAARGKISFYARKGLPLPPGWALDSEGYPTTDAIAALKGLNQPIGGPKGVGLGLVFGMLSALLSGAEHASELGDDISGPKPGRDGQVMLAINIEAFDDVAHFKHRVDAIVRQIHRSRPMKGIDMVLAPGEPELDNERNFMQDGIPMSEITLEGLAQTAEKVGIIAKWLESVS